MKVFARTDTGKVRKENQDAFQYAMAAKRQRAVILVCDGMGGANGGSLASSLAVEGFMEKCEPIFSASKRIGDLRKVLVQCVDSANALVYERAQQEPELRGMGTTLVALLKVGNRAAVANVGDSRAYLVSGQDAWQITRDHSLVQELVLRGELTPEEARSHPRKNLITRALGIEPQVQCDVFDISMKKGDLVLLCSDGLSNLVTAEELPEICARDQEPEQICDTLLELALERGAPDNVTVAVFSL